VSRQEVVKIGGGAVGASALVAAATAIGRLLAVDLTAAALLLLVAVMIATLRDRVAGGVAIVLSFLSLNYFFTAPRDSFNVDKGDDLVALFAFAAASGVLGWTVSRLDALRHMSERREREAQIRLDLTTRLLSGEEPESVIGGVADALVNLFSLAACTVRVGDVVTTARGCGEPGSHTPATPLAVRVGPLAVDVVAGDHALTRADRSLLEALVAGLATAIDRLRLESEARDARVAAQVGRTRSGFLSAVTHNLRTPLASIKAAASTLRSPNARLADTDRAELLDTIYDETDRLERLVTNILELSRIRAGALEVHRQPAALADLAQAAVRRLRPLARAHRVRLDIGRDVPDVDVDIEMMEQVLGNLLENALRYAPPGSEIRVSAACKPDGVEVRVADHGPGVPAEERERIFEEFARVDARPDATGTGLGLAIVHSLVSAHEGRVWCEETEGGGATFAFTLPAVPR
jgi:two-component system sensor histidine kinase KdpD